MIPTSSNVKVDIDHHVPPSAEAFAVLVHKQTLDAGKIGEGLSREQRDAVKRVLSGGIVKGKSNEVTVQLMPVGNGKKEPRRIIVIGLGSREKFSAECLREAGGTIAKAARRQGIERMAVVVPEVPATLPGLPATDSAGDGDVVAVRAIAEGILLGSFDYQEYKGAVSREKEEGKKSGNGKKAINFTIITPRASDRAVREALVLARATSDGQNFARTIASRPGNDINPPSLARVAQQLAKEVGLRIRVLDERELKRLGMGGILAVGAGSSSTPPRMIVLEWKGQGARGKGRGETDRPLLIVGKAITFDTGGISIKPADKMQRMIFDKSGGMVVLGVMYAVAKLQLPVHVVGILSSAENHISETAYRPGDILRMYNGVTVEVTNTDAEGRLVLGDALAWGIEQFKPSAVVDLATLTGGVIVALGKTMAGVMSNDDKLVADLERHATTAGEKIWRLPLGEDQRDYIKSDPADIVNSGGREGHPLQGGAFLSYFVKYDGKDKIPWAHLDIAGVADTEKESPIYAKGSTGWGVRTLVEWVRSRAG